MPATRDQMGAYLGIGQISRVPAAQSTVHSLKDTGSKAQLLGLARNDYDSVIAAMAPPFTGSGGFRYVTRLRTY